MKRLFFILVAVSAIFAVVVAVSVLLPGSEETEIRSPDPERSPPSRREGSDPSSVAPHGETAGESQNGEPRDLLAELGSEDEGDFLASDPSDVPQLLALAKSNCCALVHVQEDWKRLFGSDSDQLEVPADFFMAMTPYEHMKEWHEMTGGKYVLSKIGGHYIPGQ